MVVLPTDNPKDWITRLIVNVKFAEPNIGGLEVLSVKARVKARARNVFCKITTWRGNPLLAAPIRANRECIFDVRASTIKVCCMNVQNSVMFIIKCIVQN